MCFTVKHRKKHKMENTHIHTYGLTNELATFPGCTPPVSVSVSGVIQHVSAAPK